MKTMVGKRILVCGKGGSGKSTLVALMASFLQEIGYKTLVVDGDASSPEGLLRLMCGRSLKTAPKPLVEFFGGTDAVTCPVDDPSPLTRVNDTIPVPEKRIDIDREIPPEYCLKEGEICLFQAGKIETYGQGCACSIEKVVRDFMVKGDWVSLMDMKSGIEFFGRKIPDTADIILVVLDPTLGSLAIAKKIDLFCKESGMQNFWFILNKIDSPEINAMMMNKLGELKCKVVGSVSFDPKLAKMELEGRQPINGGLHKDVEHIVRTLELFLSSDEIDFL